MIPIDQKTYNRMSNSCPRKGKGYHRMTKVNRKLLSQPHRGPQSTNVKVLKERRATKKIPRNKRQYTSVPEKRTTTLFEKLNAIVEK